jgi:hypothetical protein
VGLSDCNEIVKTKAMKTRAIPLVFITALLITLSSIARAQDAVKVEKAKPVIEYKRFDPKNLPDPPPPLGPGEAAVTVYRFEVNSDGRFAFNGPAPAGDPVKIAVKVTRISLTLGLTVTIWLPKECPKALEAHEDGHLKIAEAFYVDADKVARQLAAKVVGKQASGEGKDLQAAGSDAMGKVNQKLLDDYLAAIQQPCETAQTAFDRMTAHGTNQRPTAKDAVNLSIKEAKAKKQK